MKLGKDQSDLRKRRLVRWALFGSLGALLLDLMVIGAVVSARPGYNDVGWFVAVNVTVISVCVTVFLSALFSLLFKALARGLQAVQAKPFLLPLPIAVLLLLAVGGWFVYGRLSSSALASSLPVLQASLAEVTFAKFAGDALGDRTKKPPAGWTWKEVQKTADAEAKILANLQGGPLDGYAKAATVWAAKIKDESKERKAWSALPDVPGDFELRLKPEQAEELLKAAVVDIGKTKSFGDAAIVGQDRDALLRIAAFLLVQKHWLDGLVHYREAGWLSRLATPAQAYAVEGKQTCFTTWNGKPLCSIEIQGQLTGVYEAALAAANGEKDSDKRWSESWDNASRLTAESLAANAHRLEAMGEVGGGEPDKPTERSPREQAFIDRCQVVGGLIGGASQSVGPLLSTERGMYCGYKQGANNCWRFLNVSGDYYGGGDVGCLAEMVPLELHYFMENCYANAGIVGGANQITDRMPTTEHGAYCGFKQGNKNCWRFLTASGRYFAGGDAGCPEANLLPPALGPIIRPPSPPAQPSSPPNSPTTQPAPATQTAPKPITSKPTSPKTTPRPAPAPSPSPSVPTPSPTPTPAPTPAPTPSGSPWQGTYVVTAWSGTCNSEQGKSWNFGSPYGGWQVKANGEMCGMCGCATVSASGSYLLDCNQRQAWGTNIWKLSASFSRSGDSAVANGTLWEKNYRVTSEFGSVIEPGSTYICNATFSLLRR